MMNETNFLFKQVGYGRRTKAKVRHEIPQEEEAGPNHANPKLASKMNKKLDTEQFNGPYWKCLDAAQATTANFKGKLNTFHYYILISAYRFIGTFEFDNIYKAPYPEEELKALFQKILDHGKSGADEMKIRPNHYYFSIHSRLLDYEIFNNLRQIDQNSTQEILNRFEKHDQSNMAKGRESVISGPFQIDMMAIETKGPKGAKRKHPGAGATERVQRMKPIAFDFNAAGLYEINNPNDPYCLFRAVTMVIARHTMPSQRFSEFRRSENKQREAVDNLITSMGIFPHHLFYDVEDYGQTIQDFCNENYPAAKFRLFAFKSSGDRFKHFYQSDVEEWMQPLCVFYWDEDGHYDAVKSLSLLMDNNSRFKYCFTV